MVVQARKRFIEMSAAAAGMNVDSDNGILRNIKLLGARSKNGREYTEQAMRDAVPLYQGVQMFINHPRRDDMGDDRPVQDWIGDVQRPRFVVGVNGGVYGDGQLRKESQHFAGIIEAARSFPNSIGFSHVADGDSFMRDGGGSRESDIKRVLASIWLQLRPQPPDSTNPLPPTHKHQPIASAHWSTNFVTPLVGGFGTKIRTAARSPSLNWSIYCKA